MPYDEVRGGGGSGDYEDAPILKLAKDGDTFEGELLEISKEFEGQYGPLRVLVIRQLDGEVVKVFASKILLDRVNAAAPLPGDKLKGQREDRVSKGGNNYTSARLWIERSSKDPVNRSYTVPATQAKAEDAAPAGDDAPPF
jgi:hypothetical protein